MAVFNPEVKPTNDPTYGANSRAIDTPNPIPVQGVETNRIMPRGQEIGDVSAQYEGQAKAYETQGQAIANKGYGDLFAGIVGIGDFLGKAGVSLVKKDIENRVYEVANREREAYTAELEKIKAGGVNNILDANASADEEPLPSELEDLPQTLATLRSARDAGKITKTDYQGRLLAEAKLLRAQYPGFRKEIDNEFKEVTGQNPANARVNSLITEINAAAKANAAAGGKVENFLRSAIAKGTPRADEYMAKFKAGLMTELEVYQGVGIYTQAEERLKFRALENNDRKMTREEAAIKGKDDADYGLGVVVAAASDKLMGQLGIGSPAEVETMTNMQKSGGIPAQKWAELNQITASTIAEMRVSMLADMDRTGTTKRIGGKAEAIKLVDAALEPMRTIQDRIINKDFGGIHNAATENKAMLDDTKNALLKDSKAGPLFRSIAVQKDLGGEAYLQRLNIEGALGKNGPPAAYKEWYTRWSGELESQASRKPGAAATTFNDMITEMRTKKIDDPIAQSKIVGNIVKKVEKIAQSDVPDGVKERIIESAFSPGNNQFLSKLNIDSFDERGRPVSGMNAVFQKWTSPEVTKEVKRLSAKNPELWTNYTNWTKETFGNELLNREINDLSKMQKDPNIRIDWDSENKRFNVSRTAMPELQGKNRESLGGERYNSSEAVANAKQFETVQRSVNRINSGLYNLKNVAAVDNPGDASSVDAFLLRTISDAAGSEALKNIQSIPTDMLNKILLGHNYANRK